MKLIEYRDDTIVINIPDYLTQRKGKRHFRADRRRNKNPDILDLGITLFENDHEETNSIINILRTAKGNDWMGVEQRVVIQRPTEDSEDGFELLLTATNTINGQVTHTYQIVLILSMIAVWVTIFGVGQFETFYTHCKTIIGSIKVAKVEGIQPGAC